jgi:hypothetical protein
MNPFFIVLFCTGPLLAILACVLEVYACDSKEKPIITVGDLIALPFAILAGGLVLMTPVMGMMMGALALCEALEKAWPKFLNSRTGRWIVKQLNRRVV